MRGATRKKWKPNIAWFWRGVDERGPRQKHMKSNCWVWCRSIGWHGYGFVYPIKSNGAGGNPKQYATLIAHRVAWELEVGPIPEGKLVLHHCDNRSCVRPSHLFIGDDKANMDDMYKKKRGNKSKGEEQHLAKLTEKAVIEIRQARKSDPPVPLEELAERFGVSLVAVSYAAIGKTWKHVSEPPVLASERGSSHDKKGRFSS